MSSDTIAITGAIRSHGIVAQCDPVLDHLLLFDTQPGILIPSLTEPIMVSRHHMQFLRPRPAPGHESIPAAIQIAVEQVA